MVSIDDDILALEQEVNRLEKMKELQDVQRQIKSTEEEGETGFFASIGRGARAGGEELGAQAKILSELAAGKIPEPIPVTPSEPLGFSRKAIGQFIGRTGVESTPTLGATFAGAGAGAGAGSVVPGVGTVAGGLVGAAVGAGSSAATQAFASHYNEARLAGLNHDESMGHAVNAAKVSGLLNAILAGPASAVGLKQAILPYIAKQTAIQVPGAATEQIAQNVLAQQKVDPERELTAGVKEAAIGSTAFQALPLAAAFPKIVKNKFKNPDAAPTGERIADMPEQAGAEPPIEAATPEGAEPLSEKNITPESVRKQKTASELKQLEEEIAKLEEHLNIPVEERTAIERDVEPQETVMANEPLPDVDNKEYGPVDIKQAKEKIFGAKEKEDLMSKVKKKASEFWERPSQILNDKIFDRLAPVKKLGEEVSGYTMERENVPYRMSRFAQHLTGVLESSFKHGTPTWDREQGIISIDTARPGLLQALEPVLTSPDKLSDFEAYAYARRVKSMDLIQQEKERNINPAEAESLVRLAEENPEFERVFDDVQAYKKQVLDIAEDTGLINKEQRDQWEGIDHIPFYRNLDESFERRKIGVKGKQSLAGQKAPIHELTGGKERYAVFDQDGKLIDRIYDKGEAEALARQVNGNIEKVGAPTADIVQNLAQNAAGFLQASMRNAAANRTIQEGVKGGFVKRIKKAESTRQGELAPDVVKTKVGGKDAYFQIEDPLLYSALKSTQVPKGQDGAAMNTLSWFKNMISKSIVIAPTVQFGIGVKDLIMAHTMGKDPMPSLKQTASNMVKSYKHEFGKEPDARVVEMMGMGADVGFFKTAPDKVLKRVEDMVKENNGTILTMKDKAKKIFTTPLEALEKIGRAQELGLRLSKYDAAKKKGATSAEAGFEAMDYMDYAMRGSSDTIQMLGKIVPFFSTHLQGIQKIGREIASKKGRNRTVKMMSYLAAFSMANAMMNLREDESEEDEANNYFALPKYVRNANLVIDLHKWIGKKPVESVGLNRFIMIPKPWEVGQLAMGIPEQLVFTLFGDAGWKESMDFAVDNIMGTLSINPLGNPLVKTSTEQWANKKFFTDQSIVPRVTEGLEPSLQYGPGTGETARRIGEFANVSPARLEHAMTGLAGIAYTWPVMVSDWLLEPQKAEKAMADRAFFNKFMYRAPLKQSGYQEEFYDLFKEAGTAYRTAKTYNDLGKVEWLDSYLKDKGKHLYMRKGLNKIKTNLKKIYDAQIKIDKSEYMTPKDKREQIDQLNQSRNAMLLRVHKMTKEVLKDKG